MRVLHLCPLWYPIALDAPGGIETNLAGLLPALRDLGVENAVIATGDSKVEAELIAVTPDGLCAQMETGGAEEHPYYELEALALTAERVEDFDLVHSHIGYAGFSLDSNPAFHGKLLHTWQTPITQDLQWFLGKHAQTSLTVVSDYQADKLRAVGATSCHVVPNAIDVGSFPFGPGGEQLAFMGRMEPQKGPDLAIEIARAVERPLVLAGPVIDAEFFESRVRPLLGGDIEYVGVLDHTRKVKLLGSSACVLMTSRWPEPFGMVSIEAMACGTPVAALANGALPEVVEDGITGCVAPDKDRLATVVPEAIALDRQRVRSRVAERYDVSAIAKMYVELYEQLLNAAVSGVTAAS